MLVGKETDPNDKRSGVSTISSGTPQIQSLWGRSTNAVYSERGCQCQRAGRLWV